MAKAKNTVKSKGDVQTEQSPSSRTKAPKKARFKKPALPTWLADERTRKIIGAFLTLTAVFFFLAGLGFWQVASMIFV